MVGVVGGWVGCYKAGTNFRFFSLFNTYRMIWCFAGNTTYLETAAYSFILGFRGIRGHWHDGKSEGYAAVTSMGG